MQMNFQNLTQQVINKGVVNMQVNNLKIKYSKLYSKYYVETPDKINLEEFDTQEQAIQWAKDTKDFVKKS